MLNVADGSFATDAVGLACRLMSASVRKRPRNDAMGLVRQFEFVQNVWVHDPNFHELGNEHDPMIGTQDGTFDFSIPKRPIRKKIKGLPAFTTVRGGAYFFIPGIKSLQYLAALGG
jgi:hypothetical protein